MPSSQLPLEADEISAIVSTVIASARRLSRSCSADSMKLVRLRFSLRAQARTAASNSPSMRMPIVVFKFHLRKVRIECTPDLRGWITTLLQDIFIIATPRIAINASRSGPFESELRNSCTSERVSVPPDAKMPPERVRFIKSRVQRLASSLPRYQRSPFVLGSLMDDTGDSSHGLVSKHKDLALHGIDVPEIADFLFCSESLKSQVSPSQAYLGSVTALGAKWWGDPGV
jgi:hypothetical protein